MIRDVGAERVKIGSDDCFDMRYEQAIRYFEHIDLRGEHFKMMLGGAAPRRSC